MLLFFSFSLLFSKNKLKLNYPSTAHHHLVVTVSHRIITLCKLRNKKVNFLFVEVVPFFFCSRRAKRRWQRRRSLLLFNRPGPGSESFQVLTEDVIMFCFVFFKVYWKAISNKCVMLLKQLLFPYNWVECWLEKREKSASLFLLMSDLLFRWHPQTWQSWIACRTRCRSTSRDLSTLPPLPPPPPPLPRPPRQPGRTERARGGAWRISTSSRFSAKAASARWESSEEACEGDVYLFVPHYVYN